MKRIAAAPICKTLDKVVLRCTGFLHFLSGTAVSVPLVQCYFIRSVLISLQHSRSSRFHHALSYKIRQHTRSSAIQFPLLVSLHPKHSGKTHRPSQMSLQPFLPMLMHRMSLPNIHQTIPHQKLIIPRCENRSRYIHQNRNPAIIHKRESFPAEENGRNNTRAEITGKVGADTDVCETPDHVCVCKTDDEGSAGGGYKGICWVKTGPDNDANEGVDEEFDEEEIS